MAQSLDKASRILYRTLLKSAKTFDIHPACKALVCRDLGTPLPDPLDKYVARFLGGENQKFFWPTFAGEPKTVFEAVREAFRQPVAAPTPDDSFQALRYLTGVLSIAEKHGMLEAVSEDSGNNDSSPSEENVPMLSGTTGRILPAVEQGALLIAHPCMSSWFSRTIVLLCEHKQGAGTHGLCLNMPSDKPAGRIVTAAEDFAEDWAKGGQRDNSTTSSSTGTASFFLDHSDNEDIDEEELEARLIEVLERAHKGETAVIELDDEDTAMAVANALSDADQFLETFVVASSSEMPHNIFGSGTSGSSTSSSTSRSSSSSTQSGRFSESTGKWLTRRFGCTLDEIESAKKHRNRKQDGGVTGSKKYRVLTSKEPEDDELCSETSTGGNTSGSDDDDNDDDADDTIHQEGEENDPTNDEFKGVINTKQLMLGLPDSTVYFGGPVHAVNILHGLKELGGTLIVPGKEEKKDGICDAYLGIDANGEDVLKEIKRPGAARKIRLFLGDSRWVAGQLETELENGSWLLCKLDASILDVFGESYVPGPGQGPQEVQVAQWERMLRAIGSNYAELAKVPVGVFEDLVQLKI